MSASSKIVTFTVASAFAVIVSLATGLDGTARAAKKKKAPGGVFTATSFNVGFAKNVPANQILELVFTQPVDPASVGPATLWVRAKNATGTGYTKQTFGSFQVSGNVVRFFPRLPTHLRDANGNFYAELSANDDASDNAAFQPSTDYRVFLIGRPNATSIRSVSRRPLKNNLFSDFSIAPGSAPDVLYTTRTYSDSPPPQTAFSNPSDTVPTKETQFAVRGGTKGVPNDMLVQLYCTRVPLSVTTARVSGNVALTMLERYGNPLLRRPVQASIFVEQNFETTLLVVKPAFPLADRGFYGLRVSKNLKDLTEKFDFLPNRERDRLRQIYEELAAFREQAAPGTPAADLPEPSQSLVADWPPESDTAARGVLKANLLALGDSYPDELDPRIMLLFSTRDEPVSTAQHRVEFLKNEGLYDAVNSSGEWDQSIPGAASAIFTAAAGEGTNGDFLPTQNTTVNADTFPNRTINWRKVSIPANVKVTITGTRPARIRCLEITLADGAEIFADGQPGQDSSANPNYTSYYTTQFKGGAGGPGGGRGGDSATGSAYGAGGNGTAGVDENGNPAPAGEAGSPGSGGRFGTASNYTINGGGGGGGGARLAGENGANSVSAPSNWNQSLGGAGGAGSANDDLDPLVGGAGGGAGGSGYWGTQGWYQHGGGGGGGGGGLMIQTSGNITVGAAAGFRARGGRGGTGAVCTSNYWEPAPGGGGGGGSILLRTTRNFVFTNPTTAAIATRGPRGTTPGSVYGAPYGGAGGDGYVEIQDQNGGQATAALIPGSSPGTFDPVGGGVPSFVYSKWSDLGVDDPRVLPWTNADVKTDPTTNDAVLVQVQMTKENLANFGTPDTSKIDAAQNSTDVTTTSQWVNVKVHDRTGLPGTGAFVVSDYNPGTDGTEFSGFPIGGIQNRGYRFLRFRIFFQLDQTHRTSDPLPNVDYIVTTYQYNL